MKYIGWDNPESDLVTIPVFVFEFMLVCKIYFSVNRQLTVCGLCGHSGNFKCPILLPVHIDGAACLLISLQEVSPC